jgi:hypothetical protein
MKKSNSTKRSNASKPMLCDFVSGDKVVFSPEFKKIINELPEQDWLWYIQNNEFEVKEVVGWKISIKGLHVLGFIEFWHFNIA